MYFTDENPPALTEAQLDTITGMVRDGARIQGVTLHPYSGAATLSNSWKHHAGTIAIVEQDGSYNAILKGYPKPEWVAFQTPDVHQVGHGAYS